MTDLMTAPAEVPAVERDVFEGAVICAGFGALWSLWGASGLDDPWAGVARSVGVAVGLIVAIAALRMRRGAPPAQETAFRSSGYRRTVLLEVVLIVAGAAVLGALGDPDWVIVWTAAVVGAHFLPFGRMFTARFYVIGAGLLAAAAAGALVGAADGGGDAILATTGLSASAMLLAAGIWTLLGASTARR